MKKNKNKGFLLTELLVTATLVATVLIFLYTQFYNVKRSYDNSFQYNTVNNLYALNNLRIYLINGGFVETYADMANNGEILTPVPYLVLASKNNGTYSYFISTDYFHSLITVAKISHLYFTKENLNSLKTYLSANITGELESLRRFVNYIDYDSNNSGGYRLIGEFEDGTFATLLVGGD